MRRYLLSILSILFVVMLSYVVVTGWAGRMVHFVHDPLYGVVFAVTLVVAAVTLFFFLAAKPKMSRRRFLVAMITAVIFATGIHLIVAMGLASDGHSWDAGVVYMLARHYAETGAVDIPPPAWETNYLATYPNNIPITFLLAITFRIAHLFGGSSYIIYSQMINSAAILGTFYIIVYLATRLYGRRAGAVSLLFCLPLLVISPYAPVTYTDTLGGFAVALTLLLMVMTSASSGVKKLVLGVLLGCAIYIGYLIKPTVLIIVIALCAIFFVYSIGRKHLLKKDIIVLTSVLIGVCLAFSCYTAMRHTLGFANYTKEHFQRYEMPIHHFLGMGSLRGLDPWSNCAQGSFCADYVDWAQSTEGLDTLKERKDYGVSLWRASFTESPIAYLQFISGKLSFSYNDGSFGAWGEGNNSSIQFKTHSAVSTTVRSYVSFDGEHRNIARAVVDAIWLLLLMVLLVGGVLSLIDKVPRGDVWAHVMSLSLIGLSIYVMLFETRARYLFLYLPVFILLACWGASVLGRKIKGLGT